MNVLVVGRGGREHSLIMKLQVSEKVDHLYVAPGNGGMENHATCIAIDEMDIEGLIRFAKAKAIDLTIVGPEVPLNAGIVNCFMDAGLAIFAPTKEAAQLEGSKHFAKEFMKKYGIPTAAYAVFTNADEAKAYITQKGAPIVIKADGLASGKGVIVAETEEEAYRAIDDMLVAKVFAESGATIVIEECLIGEEFSLMAFVHENRVFPMIPARDHKRAYDDDQGPNTGGMGAYAPVLDVTEDILGFCQREILQKTADGLMEESRPFTGILYAGLMMTAAGPKVIEFNTRFGDPETQVVLPLLKNDLLQVILDVMSGNDPELEWENGYCTGVVVASIGYPLNYRKGVELPVLEPSENSFVVHAGTKRLENGKIQSDGGRVLLVGAKGKELQEASDVAYEALAQLEHNQAFFYRKDIGKGS